MPVLTPSEWGLVGLTITIALYSLGLAHGFRAVLSFVSIVLVGQNYLIGKILTGITMFTVHLAGRVIGHGSGVAVGNVLGLAAFAGLLIYFIHDLRKDWRTGKRTTWFGFALGALTVAGVTGIPALSGLHDFLAQSLNTLTSAIG